MNNYHYILVEREKKEKRDLGKDLQEKSKAKEVGKGEEEKKV